MSYPQTIAMHTLPPTAPTASTSSPVQIKHKFVRVKEVRSGGLVCFEFAIGWPELFVDLMLPKPAFDDFCVQNQVQLLSD